MTICTKGGNRWFGEVTDENMKRSEIGEIAHQMWMEIPIHKENVTLDEFIIMPNHVHGIIILNNQDDDHGRDAINRVSTGGSTTTHNPMLSPHSLPNIIREYKSRVSFEVHKKQLKFLWQPLFYEHIIRDEKDLHNV